MTALSVKDQSGFIKQLIYYLIGFAVLAPTVAFYRYAEERFALYWRRWLTDLFLERYLLNQKYYQISLGKSLDNPDQRLTEDVRTFTGQSVSFFLIFMNAVISLIAFVGILYSISGYLPAVAVVYAAVGSLITSYLGLPLVDLNFQQLQKEANFRYKLINVRDNSESIAFYRGDRRERWRAREKLKFTLENLKKIVTKSMQVNFFTNGYNYVIAILPTVVVAPLYLSGKIQFGEVTQAGIAFGQVLGALSIIIANFQGISSYAAVIERLGELSEILDDSQLKTLTEHQIKLSESTAEKPAELQFKDLSILTPGSNKPIVQGLTLSVGKNNLLISGPSGMGKTSIFRAIAGLWIRGKGEVIRPQIKRCMFVPQRPICPQAHFDHSFYMDAQN